MTPVKEVLDDEKSKLAVVGALLAIMSYLTYYSHAVLGVEMVFAHLFYIPIVLACVWWKRSGLVVAIFSSALLLLSHILFTPYEPILSDLLRAGMFVAVGAAVVILSEQLVERGKAMRESEEKFRTISESAKDAIVVMDNDGNTRYWNRAAEEMFGYTSDEVVGKGLHHIIAPEKYHEAHERGFSRFKDTGEGPVVGKTVELSALRKDGSEFPVELSISSIKVGGKWNAVAIIRDITERKRQQEALEVSERKYSTLVESSNDGIFIIQDERVAFANQNLSHYLHYSIEEIIGEPFIQFVAPEYRDMVMERYRKRLAGEDVPSRYEVELLSKDGTGVPVELNASTIEHEGRAADMVVMRDITERKAAEKTHAEFTEVLRVLNSILRHDILNDLNVVGLSLELFEHKGDKKYLQSSLKAVDKSVELIKRMRELELVISRGEGLKPLDVREVVDKVIENYSIDFSVEGDCTVLADEALRPVIDNIVRNAVLHGKTDRIDISIESKNGTCEIRVADSGVGIPDELKQEVFEEGFKHGKTGHTGLGLYIVKKVIERYGGDVFVEDNEPTGAVFVLRLKRSGAEA